MVVISGLNTARVQHFKCEKLGLPAWYNARSRDNMVHMYVKVSETYLYLFIVRYIFRYILTYLLQFLR